jgi:hypothetical protein
MGDAELRVQGADALSVLTQGRRPLAVAGIKLEHAAVRRLIRQVEAETPARARAIAA